MGRKEAAKHGITCLNAPGTVDSDYRGEVGVILVNHSDEDFAITRGLRIAQLVIAPVVQARLEERDSGGNTARGQGGFGSTGRPALTSRRITAGPSRNPPRPLRACACSRATARASSITRRAASASPSSGFNSRALRSRMSRTEAKAATTSSGSFASCR